MPMFGTILVPTPMRKTVSVELSFLPICKNGFPSERMGLHAEGVQEPRRAPTFDM